MAADTKRVPYRDLIATLRNVDVTLDDLRAALAAQGLHVVTAADKAVLDAWSSVPEHALRSATGYGTIGETCRAELARREAAK